MSAEIRQLRARIDTLEEEIRQLREALRPELHFPVAWRLVGQRRRFAATLYARGGVVAYETLRIAVVGLDREVHESYVKTIACLTRKRLAPFGIEIGTAPGEGFYLTPESRRIIAAALSAIAAGEVA